MFSFCSGDCVYFYKGLPRSLKFRAVPVHREKSVYSILKGSGLWFCPTFRENKCLTNNRNFFPFCTTLSVVALPRSCCVWIDGSFQAGRRWHFQESRVQTPPKFIMHTCTPPKTSPLISDLVACWPFEQTPPRPPSVSQY